MHVVYVCVLEVCMYLCMYVFIGARALQRACCVHNTFYLFEFNAHIPLYIFTAVSRYQNTTIQLVTTPHYYQPPMPIYISPRSHGSLSTSLAITSTSPYLLYQTLPGPEPKFSRHDPLFRSYTQNKTGIAPYRPISLIQGEYWRRFEIF